jgi:hypothetical protein
MEQDLKRRIEELEKKVNDLYNPASFPNPVVESLVSKGFFKYEGPTFLSYLNPNGKQFFEMFVRFKNESIAIGLFKKIDYKKIESINVATDTITSTNHGFIDNKQVRLATAGIAPGGLSNTPIYYIRDATTNTFKLTDAIGDPAIDITSTGGGFNYIVLVS